MKWILDDKELLELVLGTATRPAAPSGAVEAGQQQPASASTAQTSTTQQYDADLAAYNKKVKKARSIIGATVSESIMVYIEGLNDPLEMWTVLEEKYNPKTPVTLRQAMRSSTTIRKSDDESMETHLQRVQRLKRRVEEQGEAISNNNYIGVLLDSVSGDQWKVVVDILESTANLMLAMVINRLLEEERKLLSQNNEGVVSKKQALTTKVSANFKSGKVGGKFKKKSTLKCSGCGKPGHVESDCWGKHPEKRPEWLKEKEKSGDKGGKGKFAMTAYLGRKGAKLDSTYWYLDSGASEHFSPYPELFNELKQLDEPCEIITAEGTTVYGTGIGTITISVLCEDYVNVFQLNDVIYAPKMDSNLLSIVTLMDRGYEVDMHPVNGANVLFKGTTIANTIREGRLFRLKTVEIEKAQARVAVRRESVGLWHRRLGHLGEKNVFRLEEMADGMKVDQESTVGVCGSCLEGGQTKNVSTKPRQRVTAPLELIHSDLCGEITPTSLGGAVYCVMFHDDATQMTHIAPMKTKTAKEMLEKFKEFKAEVENQLGLKVKRLRTDGGGEYKGAMEKFLKEEGIIHEVTAPYSPEQNGVSERANRTVIQRVKAILAETGLPKTLWMEIAQTVVYLKNRSPTRVHLKTQSPTQALEGNKTPYEAWHGKKPDLQHLKVLGTTSHVFIPKEKRIKLDFNTRECRLVGYGGTNQYRLYDPLKDDVIVSRNVIFDSEEFTEETAVLNIESKPIYDEIVVQPLPRAENIPNLTEIRETEERNQIRNQIRHLSAKESRKLY